MTPNYRVVYDTRWIHLSYSGYRQPQPWNQPLPYWKLYATSYSEWFDARNYNSRVEYQSLKPSGEAILKNVLHSRFQGRLGESASFGATLTAEARETFSMLSGTVLRLARAARSVHRMDFATAARELGLPYKERTARSIRYTTRTVRGRKRPGRRIVSRTRVFQLPTGREVQKTLANGWLFYSYGVKPLAQDIYTGLDTLQKPLSFEERVRVGARDGYSFLERDDRPGYYPTVTQWQGTVQGACGAVVSVSNPNLYLLNKMGLANPAQWVLEAIPFSFVVDWFSNLSQVVGQFNEYLGMDVKRPWMSIKYDTTRSFTTASPYGGSYRVAGFVMVRELSLPTPTLIFAYERFGIARALNAISLLVGFLPRK